MSEKTEPERCWAFIVVPVAIVLVITLWVVIILAATSDRHHEQRAPDGKAYVVETVSSDMMMVTAVWSDSTGDYSRALSAGIAEVMQSYQIRNGFTVQKPWERSSTTSSVILMVEPKGKTK